MAVRKRKRKVTKRFYVLMAGCFAIFAIAFFLLFVNQRESKVEVGKGMALERDVNVVIIRNEKVFSVINYAAATFFATEGENITQGTTVAQVYKWGFSSKLLTDLISVEEQIRTVQEDEIWADKVDQDLNEYNSKISNKIQEIAAVVQGDSTSDIVLLERKLKELFTQKQGYLKQKVQSNAKLDALYEQQVQADAVLNNWRENITADSGGVVSFYLDGFETQLTPYNLDTITKTDIENARKGVVSGTGKDTTSTKPLYRLVNNYKWYCVIYVDANHTIDEMKEGANAQLTFEGYYDRPYSAKVLSVRIPEGGGKMYVLEMSEDVSPLLSVRTANARLLLNFEGYKVPSDAIFTQNKQTMLKVEQNDTIVLVPVEVLIDDGKSCIVKNLSQDTKLDEKTVILLR